MTYQAHARATDPDTSHAAAASVSDVRESQLAVLKWLRAHGPCTDETLVRWYSGRVRQSPSGLRTRRRELVNKGLVRDTGERRRLDSGRQAIVWEAVT